MLNEEELVEAEELREEEYEEEAGEIVVDQLRLLLDVTKLWRRLLRDEATLDELKSTTSKKATKRREKAKEEGRAAKKAKGKSKRVKKSSRRRK
ncbi:MAG: hypothetical protein QXK88_04440 [Desulfurococcaceae archaeon]